MLIKVLGILSNYAVQAAGTPKPEAQQISFPRGGTTQVQVELQSELGSPVTGGTLAFTIKKSSNDYDALVKLTANVGQGGFTTFTIPAAKTKNNDPGRYVYDVWHTDGDGNRNQVVPLSPARLLPAATLL